MSVQKEKPERRASARSLAATLVTAFLVLMLIALSIAYVPQLFFFVQVGNRAIDSEQQLIASEAASTVVNFIQVKFDVLEAAARFGNPTVASLQDQERILASLMGLQPAFQHAHANTYIVTDHPIGNTTAVHRNANAHPGPIEYANSNRHAATNQYSFAVSHEHKIND